MRAAGSCFDGPRAGRGFDPPHHEGATIGTTTPIPAAKRRRRGLDPAAASRGGRRLSLRSRVLLALLAVILVAETALAVTFYDQHRQHTLNERLSALSQRMHRIADVQFAVAQTALRPLPAGAGPRARAAKALGIEQAREQMAILSRRHHAVDARIRASQASAESEEDEAFRVFVIGSAVSLAAAIALALLLARTISRPMEQVALGARQRRLLLERVIGAQEEERRRISRELHDETGQSLAALGLGLEAATEELRAGRDGGLGVKLRGLAHVANDAIEELDRLVLDLRPAQLDHLGLVATLRWYLARLRSQSGLQARLEVRGKSRRMRPEVETALFRIAQEALTNVVRHAGADSAELVLSFEPGLVSLEVIDEGAGFETGATDVDPSSLGLIGMRERAELVGGVLVVRSRLGEGTRLSVTVPLEGAPPEEGGR